jgi:hypothetical protein
MECGFRKYDELPDFINSVDVDFLRFKLLDTTKKITYLRRENRKIRNELNELIKQKKKEAPVQKISLINKLRKMI